MKLLRAVLREYADTKEYPTKRLLSKEDPDWLNAPREGEQRHGPYELFADYQKQVLRVNGDEMPFSLVGFMRPAPSAPLDLVDRSGPTPGLMVPTCIKCGEMFTTRQQLGGHARHCKGNAQ